MTTRARPWDSPAVRKRSIQANLLVAARDPARFGPGSAPPHLLPTAVVDPDGPVTGAGQQRRPALRLAARPSVAASSAKSDRSVEDGLDDRGAPEHGHDGPGSQGGSERDPRLAAGTEQDGGGHPTQ
jgi:hypothetical protein